LPARLLTERSDQVKARVLSTPCPESALPQLKSPIGSHCDFWTLQTMRDRGYDSAEDEQPGGPTQDR